MKDWQQVKLGEVLTVKYGKDHKQLKEGSIPCYGTGGIMRYVERSLSEDESILLPRKGSLNNIYYVNRPFWTVDTLFWTIVDKNKALPKYLFYVLSKVDMVSLNVGSAVPSLTVPVLNDLDINLPPLPEQKAIAHILGTLDDKIELNRQMNETLEQMAQALFKSWFVDFDPVIDRALAAGNPLPETLQKRTKLRQELGDQRKPLPAEITEQFPDSFTFTEELGWIPEGWEVKSLVETANYLNGIACQKYPPENDQDKLPVLKIKEMRNGISENSDWASSKIDEKYIIESGDIIFSWSGSLMVKIWNGDKCVLNQHLYKVYSEDYPDWFIYQWTDYHLARFIHIAESKATTMGHIKRGDLQSSRVVSPGSQLLASFSEHMIPLFSKIKLQNKQTDELISLRDTLLPKLISGEQRVPDAERLIAEHA